jgi:hypothetical protein
MMRKIEQPDAVRGHTVEIYCSIVLQPKQRKLSSRSASSKKLIIHMPDG